MHARMYGIGSLPRRSVKQPKLLGRQPEPFPPWGQPGTASRHQNVALLRDGGGEEGQGHVLVESYVNSITKENESGDSDENAAARMLRVQGQGVRL